MGSLWDHFGSTLGSLWDRFGITLGSLWGHFGVTLGLLGVTLGPFWGHLSHFDVEMLQIANVMSLCADLKGPKTENVEISSVLEAFF